MDSVALLDVARKVGLQVTTDGQRLIVRGPKQAEPLARQLLAQKAEVMALLTADQSTPAPLGHVGRHGAPCDARYPPYTTQILHTACRLRLLLHLPAATLDDIPDGTVIKGLAFGTAEALGIQRLGDLGLGVGRQ